MEKRSLGGTPGAGVGAPRRRARYDHGLSFCGGGLAMMEGLGVGYALCEVALGIEP